MSQENLQPQFSETKINISNFSPKLHVAICVMVWKDLYLLLKSKNKKIQNNTWGVPGGKVDMGETPFQSVIREIKEETGIHVNQDDLSGPKILYSRLPEVDYVLNIFFYRFNDETRPDVNISDLEHQAYDWFKIDDALKLDLIAGERDILKDFHSSFL